MTFIQAGVANLSRANGSRITRAAERDVADARILLRHADWFTDLQRVVICARINYPGLSWGQIGVRLGITKNAAACAFRRARLSELGQRALAESEKS